MGMVGRELLSMGDGWCNGHLLAMQPAAPGVKEPVRGQRESEKPPAKDLSLTMDEYVALGVPSATKLWNGDDYLKAVRVLKSLAATTPEKLPRYQSERSGELFSRMTSTKNLEQFRDRQVALQERFPQMLGYYDAINQILKVYLTAFQAERVSDSDLLGLMGNMMHASVVMLDVVDEFLPTLDKNDPKYEVRMRGLNQMKNGMAQVVTGGLLTLTERSFYRTSELRRLIGVFQETMPLIVSRLTPQSQADVLMRLEKMQADTTLTDLQPDLRKLQEKISRIKD